MRPFFLLSSGKTKIKLVQGVFIILSSAISLFVVHIHTEGARERKKQSAIKKSK